MFLHPAKHVQMKTLTSLLFCLCITASAMAMEKCERLAFYDMRDITASIEKDLLSHTWKSGMLGYPSTLFFRNDGSVLDIATSDEKVNTWLWTITDGLCGTELRLYRPDDERRFAIAPTCSGISASANGKVSSMLPGSERRKSEQELDFLKTRLTGTWKCDKSKSHKAVLSQFHLTLQGDGTFGLKPGPDLEHSAQKGFWQLSDDGAYLILHTLVYMHNKEHYIAETISLKSVDFEDMVIATHTLPRALGAYEGRKDLYLAKLKP
jgi:hypothetical protein